MKRIGPILIVVLVVAAFGGTMVFLYQKSRAKPVHWKTQKPFVADITKKTVVTGALVPRREVALKSRVSGVIEKLYVEPGQDVKAGDPIAGIRIIPDMATLTRSENGVEAAKIARDGAQRELEANEPIFKQGVISATEYRQFKVQYDLKQSELDGAYATLKIVRDGASRKVGVASNIVTSTVAGRVLEVPVKEGESVTETNTFNAGTTIASVADMKDMIFQGKVDESEVGKLKEGMSLEIKIGALKDQVLAGTLEYISPKGANTDGTIQFEVRAAISIPSDMLIRAGYSANADIVLDRRKATLAIRESVLQFDDGKPYVEIEVGAQRFEKRTVEVGLSDGIQIEVKAGVDKDTSIKDPVAPRG